MSNTRYQAYFAVEGGWFNELPAHWQKLPSNRVFEQRREAAKEDDEQLSATQKYGVVPQSLFMALDDRKVTLALAGTDNFKHVDEGNFVISLRSFEGGIELSKYSGCVSPAYTCLKARKPIANDYYKFALKCSDYILALQSVTQGIRDGKNISYGEFSKLNVPYPPPEEQLAIATFLDRETAKIDDLIAEQKRLIELLQEKRQAEVSHAVTKGLNPDAPMKHSGVEWLGEVPDYWRVIPLRWAAKCCSGDGLSSAEISSIGDDEYMVRVIGGNGLMGYTNQAKTTYSLLAIGRVGALCGNVHIVHSPAWITDNALVLDPDPLIFDLGFLSLTLRSRNLNDIASKTAQPLITSTQVSDQRIPCPPLSEQQLIASYLSQQSEQFDTLSTEAQRAIDLLQERRSALISAAVTGKIDVRCLFPEAVAA